MAEDKNNNNKRLLILAIIALFLLGAVGIYSWVTIRELTPKPISNEEQQKLDNWSSSLSKIQTDLGTEQKKIQEVLKTLPAKSDEWRMQQQLLKQIKQHLLSLKTLDNEIKNYRDTNDLERINIRVDLAKMKLENLQKDRNLARDISLKFSRLEALNSKVDSLNRLINDYKSRGAAFQAKLTQLRNEKSEYIQRIERLKSTSLALERRIDSLNREVAMADTTIDSLGNTITLMRDTVEKAKWYADKNAELARSLDLWYFVKDRTRRPKRRVLIEDPEDFNRGNDIRTIHGQFSLNAETFEEFKIANIYLYKTDGDKSKVTEAKMSVREQLSSEFTLTTPDGLDEGSYLVEVIYNGETVLTQKFYVTT